MTLISSSRVPILEDRASGAFTITAPSTSRCGRYWEAGKYDHVPPYGLQPGTLLQAVRMGKWKAVKNSPDAKIELYDLSNDLGEKHNIAQENPEIVQQMSKIMKASHRDAPPQVDMTAEEAERLYVPREKKK